MNTLFRSSFRYFLRHPWQLALSVLGVALGVAIVIAIDLANTSARAAFEQSSNGVSGKATHHIVGSTNGFADSIYATLKTSPLPASVSTFRAAPVVEGNVIVVKKGAQSNSPKTAQQQVFKVFGIDIFAERDFRTFLNTNSNARNFDLAPFFTQKNACVLSSQTASELGLRIGDTLQIQRGGKTYFALLVGTITPSDEASKRALSSLLVCDISTAQELLEMQGKLSRIDLILQNTPEAEEFTITGLQAFLPNGCEITRSQARPKRIADMARAFDLNLTALSLLALIVGLFIIFNAMTFSVVQRRQYIGMLRLIGTTQKQVFVLILGEALVIGLVGTILGLALGIILGNGFVRLIAQTINDLYFTVQVSGLEISPLVLLKGALLGTFGVIGAALLPAREATQTPPRLVLNRSQAEQRILSRVWVYAGLGVVAIGVGVAWLMYPSASIYAGYAGLLPVIIGFALLVPLVTLAFVRIFQPILRQTSGFIGSMAVRGIATSLSRTGIAIASLMVAVSATIGVGVMVNSFRQTVVEWLTYTLTADIYISPPSLIARRGDAVIDSIALHRITTHPHVQEWTSFRTILAEAHFPEQGQFLTSNTAQNKETRLVQVLTTNLSPSTAKRFHFKETDDKRLVWEQFRRGEAIISEAFSFKNKIVCGDSVEMSTDAGLKRVRVCGIYYEYASDIGIIVLERSIYNAFWNDRTNSGISIFVKNGIQPDSLIHDLQLLTSDRQELNIRSNRALLATSLEIFDRTFAITDVLRLLTIFVSFVGVLSALMALQFEKAREIGVLRANGVTPRQVWLLTTIQTTLIGLLAGILALPMGIILALTLIYVINQRSFGWSLQFFMSPEILLQAVMLSIVAAFLAGLYPAWKSSRIAPALALREE